MRLHPSLLVLVFVLAAACGSSSSSSPADAGPDAPTSAPGATPCGAIPTLKCVASAEMCLDDYASAGGFNPKQQCVPLPAACARDHSCACVTAAFKCGITTSCTVEADGHIAVTCQPD